VKCEAEELIYGLAAGVGPAGKACGAEDYVVFFAEGDGFAFAVNLAGRSN